MSRSEVLKFSAGGFRDFTRIAASDPTMWRDVFLHNKDAVLEMLAQFNEDLARLTRAMRRGDGDALFEHFTRRARSAAASCRSGRIPPRPTSAVRIPRRRRRDPATLFGDSDSAGVIPASARIARFL